jgi:hypothetical protein
MWRTLRIAILLLILGIAAYTTLYDRFTTTDWDETLWIGVFPVNAGASTVTAGYIDSLKTDDLAGIERFINTEARRHGVTLSRPVRVDLYPEVHVRQRAIGALRLPDAAALPQPQVRVPAEQHVLEQGALRRRIRVLRKETEPSGDLAPWNFVNTTAIELHFAGRGGPQTRERAQQQRLAGAVAAEQGDEFAATDLRVECVEQHAPGHGDPQLTSFEPHAVHGAWVQRISRAVASPTRTSVSDSGISNVPASTA